MYTLRLQSALSIITQKHLQDLLFQRCFCYLILYMYCFVVSLCAILLLPIHLRRLPHRNIIVNDIIDDANSTFFNLIVQRNAPRILFASLLTYKILKLWVVHRKADAHFTPFLTYKALKLLTNVHASVT